MLYYTQLPEHDIRLVVVLPLAKFNACIECELQQHKVSNAPPYEDLSYVWGDPDDRVAVICNGFRINVTRSLRNAIRRIGDPVKPKTIWVDALCLNQNSIRGKNVHVSLMTRVHSQATSALIYLGGANHEVATTVVAGLLAIFNSMEE